MEKNSIREALGLPVRAMEVPVSPATDPMAAAWAYSGRYWQSNHRPYWQRASVGNKAYLLAVATLNVQGAPATPLAVQALMKCSLSAVRQNLRYLSNDNKWSSWLWSPLTRTKFGRTHEYVVNQPVRKDDYDL